jgi:hypothetical protein
LTSQSIVRAPTRPRNSKSTARESSIGGPTVAAAVRMHRFPGWARWTSSFWSYRQVGGGT